MAAAPWCGLGAAAHFSVVLGKGDDGSIIGTRHRPLRAQKGDSRLPQQGVSRSAAPGTAVDGRAPTLGLLISIEEAYTQCPKALIRSELWNPDRHVDSSELPTAGGILKAVADPTLDADDYNRERAERYARREGLY
jgi:hypothetical protein